ncbi:MAG: hypothetical protein RLZZ187_3458 [Pseudomonadota bacterium]|jgi:hypothetical protein
MGISLAEAFSQARTLEAAGHEAPMLLVRDFTFELSKDGRTEFGSYSRIGFADPRRKLVPMRATFTYIGSLWQQRQGVPSLQARDTWFVLTQIATDTVTNMPQTELDMLKSRAETMLRISCFKPQRDLLNRTRTRYVFGAFDASRRPQPINHLEFDLPDPAAQRLSGTTDTLPPPGKTKPLYRLWASLTLEKVA